MSRHSLDLFRHIQKPVNSELRIIELLQIRTFLHCPLDGHTEMARNQLGDLVYFSEGNTKHSANITHRCACSHRSKRNNLRNMLGSVFFYYIRNNLIAPFVAKIYIDIGHRYPLGIQKTFKKQMIFYRINVRNMQHIGNQTARRRAPSRSGRYSIAMRKGNKIPYY
ncbi:hypothetical protein D3C74_311800 [compost metagenome]